MRLCIGQPGARVVLAALALALAPLSTRVVAHSGHHDHHAMSGAKEGYVRTVAAYNGGPGNVARWDNTLNASADPLLYIASIPLNETRDFVQRVLANYWMYQIRLGQPTPSLDQIAAHEWPRYQQDVAGR